MRSGDLVKTFREKKGLSQRELAEKTGTTHPMISRWESNQTFPSYNLASIISDELGIPEDQIMPILGSEKLEKQAKAQSSKAKIIMDRIAKKNDPKAHHLSATIAIETEMTARLTKLIHVPILGSVPAGPLAEVLPKMRSEAEEWEYLDEDKATNPELVFGLHVVGESMIGRDINDGDVIIVDPCLQPENGDIVVAMVNSEATVKTFYKQGSILTLQSANQRIEPIILTENDYDHIKIVGVVIKKVTKMRK